MALLAEIDESPIDFTGRGHQLSSPVRNFDRPSILRGIPTGHTTITTALQLGKASVGCSAGYSTYGHPLHDEILETLSVARHLCAWRRRARHVLI
jgi:hypothetical protein